jgi:AraC family transcriptional regulator
MQRELPDHRRPAIYTSIQTEFKWIDAGLLWPKDPCNFIAHFRSNDFHIPEHTGLLSVKCAFGGQETYEVKRERISVGDSCYLILNEGQDYASSIGARAPVESLAVFFDPDFAADVLRAELQPEDHLLDAPVSASQPVAFFQQLYWDQNFLLPVVHALRRRAVHECITNGWLEEQFHHTLRQMISLHRDVRSEIDQLDSTRPSLRIELYRRLHAARDYMDSNLNESISLPEIARAACFSPHHFLRSFKLAFNETPHQYLTRRRIENARRLLSATNLSVTDICMSVGFESLGSFSWLFSKRVGLSPEAYRRETRP